ncbi:hypothetical protein [Providencia stuartii]|uniref:hypothetical protein n=1 Tax=Providencia stuartii TaxID=588 RepID=UPI00280D2CAE|nr:hypothetical protein [Providencia stuartii]ELR5082329.1 hypothetical protein [Providencia stuartii]
MKLSKQQKQTMKNIQLGYGQLCNKATLRSLEKKRLIYLNEAEYWLLTQPDLKNKMIEKQSIKI